MPEVHPNHREDAHVLSHFNRIAGGGPEPTFRKVARLTLYNLIRYTPSHIRDNRKKDNCRTYFYTSEYFKREGKRGMRIFAYKTGCNKQTYLTMIGFVDYTKNLNSSVWVSCSCDYYKYYLEYANAQLGATEHTYAWNQAPHITNPRMVPGACKHILLIIDDAMKRTRQFAKLDKNKELELTTPELDIEPDKSTEFKPEEGPKEDHKKQKPIFRKTPSKPQEQLKNPNQIFNKPQEKK
jgi:hypothetical protein